MGSKRIAQGTGQRIHRSSTAGAAWGQHSRGSTAGIAQQGQDSRGCTGAAEQQQHRRRTAGAAQQGQHGFEQGLDVTCVLQIKHHAEQYCGLPSSWKAWHRLQHDTVDESLGWRHTKQPPCYTISMGLTTLRRDPRLPCKSLLSARCNQIGWRYMDGHGGWA